MKTRLQINILSSSLKRRLRGTCFLFFLFSFVAISQSLHISTDGHRLVKEDGLVFFYMADTGWEMFHRLNKEETELYLKDRKAKGFNVIQAVILAEQDGLNTPNAEGERPLIDNNPAKPNEAYFKHADWVFKKAEELGLYIAALPSWGDKWNLRWGIGPVIFDTPEKATVFYTWLAERYKNQPNIMWILGGDRSPETPLQMEVNLAMADAIYSVDKGKHLMSYHTLGSCSAEFFHNKEWLSFNMTQTGHSAKNYPLYQEIGKYYSLEPAKPILDGEPQYEDHPVNFNPQNERFGAYDVRQAGYWSVLAGATGYAYGNNNIWQMYLPERKSHSTARIPWYAAIHQPGATQMGYMRKLFESRNFLDMIPDQEILTEVFGQDKKMIRAARGKDGSFIIVYTSFGNPMHVNMKKLKANIINGYWYNPREGTSIKIEPFENPGRTKVFVPPSSGSMTDWVLVLDNKEMGYPDPAIMELK